MKIDGIGSKGIQQTDKIKSVETAKTDEAKDIKAPLPPPPVRPEGEVSLTGEIGSAAREIAGEDLLDNKANLSRPVAEALDIVTEEREGL